MRLLRFAAFSLVLVFTSLTLAHGQYTWTEAVTNSCSHVDSKNGRSTAKCSFSADIGTAVAAAVAQYSGLGIGGTATFIPTQNDPWDSTESAAETQMYDTITVGNYPAGSSLFVAGAL